MRRYAITTLTAALVFALAGMVYAQKSGRGLAKITLDGHNISIDYGRPSLKGRNVTELLKGKLEPGDGFWRLGANSSTTYKSDTDVRFGDVTVPAGTYSLWAQRQSDNSWRLVFNKQHGQWGTGAGSHNPKLDFASVPFKMSKVANKTPVFTITLRKRGSNRGELLVHWGDMELSTHFRAS
ncbi:MAG: DUF2911 domain-containing protein [Terriglobia bacterium]